MSEEPVAAERGPKKRLSRLAYLGLGIVLGALTILAIRFVNYQPKETHYHANFAVYINGQREVFKGPQYYQEVKVCALGGATPAGRGHLHNQENGVIHIHDEAVTWGQFFANLGWTIGPDFIQTNDQLYQNLDGQDLYVRLNGQDLTGITSIANQVIEDKDRLLVSYGTVAPATVTEQEKTVPSDAGKYNEQQDPASCAGAQGHGLKDRLKHLF